jgi:metal-responsive CopG/Arc/MetJ family transcriptional regulator
MAQKTERVSARVPEQLVRDLEGIMEKEGIDSISECLRECIEEYVKLKSTPISIENILVDVGVDILSDIDNLVDIGRVSDRSEAFHSAIKSWTELQVDKYLLGRTEYLKLVRETKSQIINAREEKRNHSHLKSP